MVNVANVVTVLRVFLALFVLGLVTVPSDDFRWWSFWLTIVVIVADGLDGYLARKLNQTTKFGGILDIAGDRVVEMAYWIVFAVLQWIPVWVPLLFLVRGIFVDSVRSFLSEQGYTAFGEKTTMQSSLGKFLVASRFSRVAYAVAKAVAFCLIIAAKTKAGADILPVANFFVYFASAFCVIRGLPVLLEAPALFKNVE